jgi:hypothetical protein
MADSAAARTRFGNRGNLSGPGPVAIRIVQGQGYDQSASGWPGITAAHTVPRCESLPESRAATYHQSIHLPYLVFMFFLWPSVIKTYMCEQGVPPRLGGNPMKDDANQQPEANFESDAPPEYNASPAGNPSVWILALSPMVGVFFEVLGLVFIGMPWLIFPDIIGVVLSIYFAYADQKKLKAIGHDTSKLGPPWLVPVYLFRRAKMLEHKLTYFIVWCGLFGVTILM